MDSAISSESMLARPEYRLAALNVAVFACVLIAFAMCVYLVVVDGVHADVKTKLNQLADSTIASIDYDEDPKQSVEHAAPDVLSHVMPDNLSESLLPLRLQWFDYRGQLKLEKGTFKISVPLENGFHEQANPHGMTLTKEVLVKGVLLGHVRVAAPLEKTDHLIRHLRIGLALAIVVSMLISGAGIVILVGQAMQPLELSIRQLKQFVADASHELRNPVMAIQSNAAVALKYTEGMRESDREKFEVIMNCVEQMGRLTNDLLSLASSDNVDQPVQTANVTAALTDACTMISWLREQRHSSISTSFAESLFAKGAEDDLRRVFLNLIENALIYSPENGSITVTAKKIQTQVVVEVTDNGIGISEMDRKKIFDRFWRADKARSQSNSGNGLGLSICAALVKRAGGWIGVSSEIGKGSTFSVHLVAVETENIPPAEMSMQDSAKRAS